MTPCVWTGTGIGLRSLEHRNGCVCRSGYPFVHPFASSQPYWAPEDIKIAKGNIKLWGPGAFEEGSVPIPPPHRLAHGGVTYALATRSTVRGSRPSAMWVVVAAGRAKAAPPPIQPTAAALWALLPSTMAV